MMQLRPFGITIGINWMQLLQGQQDDNEDFTVSMKDFNGHKSFW